MKPWIIALSSALCTTLIAGPAAAGSGDTYPGGGSTYDYAKVERVEPIVSVVRVSSPRRECWDEEVTRHPRRVARSDSYVPLVLGGIVGGVVGHQFGRGRGKDAMTVAGTLLGASIGRDVGHRPIRHGRYTELETRCRVSHEYHEEERVEGYRVTYQYHGHRFVERMPYDPGDRVRVRVAITPVEG